MGAFRWRSRSRVEELARESRPVPPSALEGELVRMAQRLPARRRGLRGSVVAVAFSVLVLTGLAAGGGISTAAGLISHSVVSLKAHVSKLETRHSPSIRTLSAAISQYGQPCPQCNSQQQAALTAQNQAASDALTLAQSITNPVAKAAVATAVAQSNALAAQVNALLTQAQNTKNPVVKAKLEQAALVAANASKVLAQLAKSFALATLKAEGKRP